MWSLLAALPVNILISFILGRLQFGVQDLINRRNAELTASVAERTNNLMLIKSMGTEAKEAGTGGERMKASYRAAGMNIWVTGMALPIRAIASVLQTIVIILVGRGFYASGALSLTEWIAYYGFAVQLTNILSAYCGYWTSFKSAQGAVDRVSEIMDERSEDLDAGDVGGLLLWRGAAVPGSGPGHSRRADHRRSGAVRLGQDHPSEPDRPPLPPGRRSDPDRRKGYLGLLPGELPPDPGICDPGERHVRRDDSGQPAPRPGSEAAG